MHEIIIRLIYPPHLYDQPVIQQLVQKFDLSINIVGADLSPENAWIEVKLRGNEIMIEQAMTWLQETGLKLKISGKS